MRDTHDIRPGSSLIQPYVVREEGGEGGRVSRMLDYCVVETNDEVLTR